jgi:hypothetical protein
LRGGAIEFSPPEGFVELSAEQIRMKYPNANRPEVVYATPDMGVSVAVTFSPAQVTPEQLPELKVAMEQTLPRLIPNLSWITREIVVNNQVSWVHFELTSSAIDTDIHNHMYMTSLDGRMLGFNFNSTVAAYGDHAEQLKSSFESIKLGLAANKAPQPTQ